MRPKLEIKKSEQEKKLEAIKAKANPTNAEIRDLLFKVLERLDKK